MIEKVRKLAHSPNNLRGATGILIVTLLLSNILGVVRNYFLTRYIPVDSLDIYYAAFRLPDLIFNLLILGAIASAFIPVFTGFIQKDDQESAWHIANSVLTLAVVSLTISLIALYFLMPLIMHLVVPNFSFAQREETVRIARLMLLSPFFFGISYVLGGILNSFQRFFVYSLAPLVYNLTIISGIAFFVSIYPRGDYRQLTATAIAVVIGAFLHMLVQLPSARHVGLRLRWSFDYRHSSVRQIGKLMIPRTVGLGANQLMLVAFTSLASAIPGAVSYFNLANDIQTMPTVVFGTSFATAVFPSLSAALHKGETEQITYYISRTMKVIITLLIPASVGLILLRVGIVQILLGFNTHHVIVTANTLAAFSISLVASGLIPLFSRAFYAAQNTRTPTIISVVSILVSIIAALLLRPLGAPGLGLAFSIGSFLNAILLYLSLRRRFPLINEKDVFVAIIKVATASLVMALVIQATKIITASWMDVHDGRIGMIIQVAIAIIFATVTYILTAYSLNLKEISALWQRRVNN